MSRPPSLYADPELYDALHAAGTDDEVWLLDRIARRHGNGGRAALEPACGSGRYLAGLLRRGWRAHGYDLSPAMVAYARRRLAKWKDRARVDRGDMTSFKPARTYDLAFNLLSTFRHLLTQKDALAHLRLMEGALNPGGLFILGLDLAAYGQDAPDEETWTARLRGRTLTHVMMTLPPDARRRRETIINFVTPGPRGRVLKSAYDLRSYDADELTRLLLRTRLSLAACYGYDGRPASLCGPERSLWVVLKKSARAARP